MWIFNQPFLSVKFGNGAVTSKKCGRGDDSDNTSLEKPHALKSFLNAVSNYIQYNNNKNPLT